jgi:Fe(3+) dicitrate transport protein
MMYQTRLLPVALLAILFLFPATAHAQAGRITGTIVQDGSSIPLAGAHVSLQGTSIGSVSRPDGSFSIDGIVPGRYTLQASMIGYHFVRQELNVRAGETVRVNLQLHEHPVEIPEIVVERVTMTGGLTGLMKIPGSAHYITPQQLDKFSHNDVNRVLRNVPGVNLQEEDGYGLRPNIGMRGTGAERSSKITIMEDGVLMAPAPYAAPAAYYFPTMGRMQGVEVRKGSSQIKYGPYTTGGALNLISTQIPFDFSGRANLLFGDIGTRTVHAYLGDSYRNVGFLLETYQAKSDGFKQLDGGGGTGFEKQDYMAKLRFNTSANARVYQALTFKAGRTSETSDETYLGLTEEDFSRTPYRRYTASQHDVIDTEHRQYQMRHVIRPASFLDVTTTVYRSEFARNWYKLDKVRAEGSARSADIGAVLADPAGHPGEYAVLMGQASGDNVLEVKSNNREYYAYGVQTVVGLQLDRGRFGHELEMGLRYHLDGMDRFQWVDAYQMQNSVMSLTNAGTPGTESNRLEDARALAAFAQYRLTAGRLALTPGLRFEHIVLSQKDYGKTDPGRIGTSVTTRSNTVEVFIPGIGMDYRWTDRLTTFAGMHKGFAPPGSKEETEPESSINYEIGARYQAGTLQTEGVFFFNDYSNLLGTDLAAGGGQGTTRLFNGGEVDVVGVEYSIQHNLGGMTAWRYSVPIRLAYTFTDAAFKNSFGSTFEAWGTVEAGDKLPYVPRHQLAGGLGFENERYGLELSTKYVSRMRDVAGQGAILPSQSVDPHLVFDLAAEYAVQRHARLFGSIRNVTDSAYVVARRPAGLRPGLPRTFVLGIKANF